MPHRWAGKLQLVIPYIWLLLMDAGAHTHCCTAFPRSPQLLIIPLKWFQTCHHFHIKMICFNCTHRDVQIICCEQLIGFRSVCLQITPCLLEGFTELLNHWRYFRYFGPEGHQHCGLERADVTNGGWNTTGHFVGSTSGWWQCLSFRRLSELLSSIIHVCTEPSSAVVPQGTASVLTSGSLDRALRY